MGPVIFLITYKFRVYIISHGRIFSWGRHFNVTPERTHGSRQLGGRALPGEPLATRRDETVVGRRAGWRRRLTTHD